MALRQIDDQPATRNGAKLDFNLIKQGLSAQANILVPQWFPGGKRVGDKWVALNPWRPDTGLGSFKIDLQTGGYKDYASEEHQGTNLLDLYARLHGLDIGTAARQCAEKLGLVETKEAPPGLTLEAYAEAKLLPLDFLRDLGLATIDNPYSKAGAQCVAMPYRDAHGALIRNRLRVRLTGETKFVWEPSEVKAGLYGLDRIIGKGVTLYLVEGESDCHTLWHRNYAAYGLPGADNFNPKRDDNSLEGFPDIVALIEPGISGEDMLTSLRKSRHADRIKVARLAAFKDVSQLHCEAPDSFDDMMELAASSATALLEPEPEIYIRPEHERPKRRQALDLSNRRKVHVESDEQARVVDEVADAIQEDATLYERNGDLVRVRGDRPVPVDEHWLTDYITRRISFTQMKPVDGVMMKTKAGPPPWLAKRLGALSGDRGLPELRGVITSPVIRLDGTLLDKPGYDADTGLLLLEGDYPAIPERPSRAQMATAWATLWKPYAEFPYVSNSDRGVVLAGIFTAINRKVMKTAPAFSMDAPVPGSGKTLLANCIGMLCGSKPGVIPEGGEEEEVRKKITSALMGGQSSILFDNVKGVFKSSALEALLTNEVFQERQMGQNKKMDDMLNNVLVLFSGNNFRPGGDLPRRVLTARIDPKTEDAHKRTFSFDALVHCIKHKNALVSAALTLMRGFVTAGMPRIAKDNTGSFEDWDRMVRQCVVWLGKEGIAPVSDPNASFDKALKTEPERVKLAVFLEMADTAMSTIGDGKWRVQSLIAKAVSGKDTAEQELFDVLIDVAGNSNSTVINPRALGSWITKHADRICEGRQLVNAGTKSHATLWMVRKV